MDRMPHNAVLVVAGISGAGKTTLIRRVIDREQVTIVDNEDRRDKARRHGYETSMWLPLTHYRRIAAALSSTGPVVIHTRGTYRALRYLIAFMVRISGRPVYLLLLDCSLEAAQVGQCARGRTVRPRKMQLQMRSWGQLVARARRGKLKREGWYHYWVMTREESSSIKSIRFVGAPVTLDKRSSALFKRRSVSSGRDISEGIDNADGNTF